MKPERRRQLLQAFRFVLPWYLAVIGILGGVWLCILFYSRASPQLWDAAKSFASIIFGAVVGSLTVYVSQAAYERKKKRGELVARLPSLAYEATAALAEYFATRPTHVTSKGAHLFSPELAKLIRLEGALAQFEFEWRAVFSGRRARVAVNKMRQRIELAKEYFLSNEVNPRGAEKAVEWIIEQANHAGRVGADDAGVSLDDPGGLMFVRFGRVSEQDKRDLSFVDVPPPWKGSSPNAATGRSKSGSPRSKET
jgi:hypothetical protein